jgi:hypothetical protein
MATVKVQTQLVRFVADSLYNKLYSKVQQVVQQIHHESTTNLTCRFRAVGPTTSCITNPNVSTSTTTYCTTNPQKIEQVEFELNLPIGQTDGRNYILR